MLKILKKFFKNESPEDLFDRLDKKHPSPSENIPMPNVNKLTKNIDLKPKKENILTITYKDGSTRQFALDYKEKVGKLRPWLPFYKWLFKENRTDQDVYGFQYNKGYVAIYRREIREVQIEIVDK